jgi:hypothetical protein
MSIYRLSSPRAVDAGEERHSFGFVSSGAGRDYYNVDLSA